MSVIGTYNFNPKIAECLEEAFERGPLMAPSSIGGDHIDSAMRSIRFMLNSEWPAMGLKAWKVLQGTHTSVAGDTSFVPDEVGLQDIMAMVLRRNSRDTQMTRMSREDYLNIVDKNQRSRPTAYYVDQTMVAGVYTITVKVWQAMENSTDVFVYDYLVRLSDSGTPANTLDMPPHTHEAFVAGLSARLAEKFKPERFKELQERYCGNPVGPGNRPLGGALLLAIQESRGRVDTRFHIRGR